MHFGTRPALLKLHHVAVLIPHNLAASAALTSSDSVCLGTGGAGCVGFCVGVEDSCGLSICCVPFIFLYVVAMPKPASPTAGHGVGLLNLVGQRVQEDTASIARPPGNPRPAGDDLGEPEGLRRRSVK
jgi:hypothetical protein